MHKGPRCKPPCLPSGMPAVVFREKEIRIITVTATLRANTRRRKQPHVGHQLSHNMKIQWVFTKFFGKETMAAEEVVGELRLHTEKVVSLILNLLFLVKLAGSFCVYKGSFKVLQLLSTVQKYTK